MVYSSGRFLMLMPALLTRMSSRPNALTAAPTSVRHDSSRVTSATMPATLAPPSRSSAAAVSHFSWLRPTMTTGAGGAEPARHAEADAAIAAGDDRHFAGEIEELHDASYRCLVLCAADDRLVAAIGERVGDPCSPDLLGGGKR